MHPDDLLRPARGLGDPVDRDRRRVGREHRVRGSRRLDLAQHLLLDLEVLEHRLDDELGPAEPAVVIAPGEQRDEPGVLVGGNAAPLEPVVEDVARRSEALRNPREIGVLHAHVHPRLHDRGARNARPHEPRAHDPEAAHDSGLRWVGDSEVLFESGRSEKDLDQLTRDVGDGELPEQLRLALQTFRHAVFESVLHRFQCGERRGIVAARLGQDLLSGAAENQRPTQWVAVEQPSAEAARYPQASANSSPPPRHAPWIPTATGLGKRATRPSISCPSAESCSASEAVVSRTNSSMSAPAMKFSGFPEKNATARTAVSCSSASNVASRSCFTAAESLLTGSPFRSKVTTATPASASSQVSAAPGAISGAPAPWRSPYRPVRKSTADRTARPAGPSRSLAW